MPEERIVLFTLKNRTTAEWANGGNPVILLPAELGYNSDTKELKLGDGVKSFDQLSNIPNETKVNVLIENSKTTGGFALRALDTAGWANPGNILKLNELGYNTDTKEIKIGNGVTAFVSLPGINTAGGGSIDLSVYSTKVETDQKINTAKGQLEGKINQVKTELTQTISIAMPQGSIIMWSGTIASIPTGWALCDGEDGRPNLLDKFIKGVKTKTTNPGTTGGRKTLTLTVNNLPTHLHEIDINTTSAGDHTHTFTGAFGLLSGSSDHSFKDYHHNTYKPGDLSGTLSTVGAHVHKVAGNTSNTGNNEAIDITPEYFELAFIIKL